MSTTGLVLTREDAAAIGNIQADNAHAFATNRVMHTIEEHPSNHTSASSTNRPITPIVIDAHEANVRIITALPTMEAPSGTVATEVGRSTSVEPGAEEDESMDESK
ncbi:hypothetical protein LTR17_025425 [Elasticomyces elasticus]|nr:hypothetical protein LTR17_025425 [Elasticomyces elasticus]